MISHTPAPWLNNKDYCYWVNDSWCGLIEKKQDRTFTIALVIPYLTFKKYIIQLGIEASEVFVTTGKQNIQKIFVLNKLIIKTDFCWCLNSAI